MKKTILGIALLLSIFIITFVNIGVMRGKNIQLNVIEPVQALALGYVMQAKACPGSSGLYSRCYPMQDEKCDVSAQTLCD